MASVTKIEAYVDGTGAKCRSDSGSYTIVKASMAMDRDGSHELRERFVKATLGIDTGGMTMLTEHDPGNCSSPKVPRVAVRCEADIPPVRTVISKRYTFRA